MALHLRADENGTRAWTAPPAIDLSSEPGVGTTIAVTFPVQQEGPFA